MFFRWLTLLLALTMAACTTLSDMKTDVSESLFGREPSAPPMPLADFRASASAKVVWHANAGKAGDFDFTPAVDDKSVFVAGTEGEITRLELANGNQVWRIATGEKLSGGVGVGDNLVLVGTPDGRVLAYDHNGKPRWKAKVSSEVLSAPKVSGGVVIVRSGDSRIFGLDAVDGHRRWVYERANPPLLLRSAAGVQLDGMVAYAGFAGGKLIALKADDGKVLWEASVAQPKGTTEIERIADITSLPVVGDRLVYAAAFQGRITGTDRYKGAVVWNRDISSYNGIDAAGNHVYVTHVAGAIYALDSSSGRSYWRQGGLLNRLLTAPLVIGPYVAVGDLEGYVHFLSREDGSFDARVATEDSPVMAQMVRLEDASLLLQNRGGGVYRISVKEEAHPSSSPAPGVKQPARELPASAD